MSLDFEKVITEKSQRTRTEFRALLDKTNKENPRPQDVKALDDLLSGNRNLELWRDVLSAGHLAELMVIENARATAGLKRMLEASFASVKERTGFRGSTFTRATLDSTGRVVLAQTKPRGVGLFQHHDAINNFDARGLLGEAIECCSKAFHTRLRYSHPS